MLDLINIVCSFLQIRDQLNICIINKDTYDCVKIQKLVFDKNYILTESILKQNKFSDLIILDLSYNTKIKDINHLIYLEELNSSRSVLPDSGISELKFIKKLNVENNKFVKCIEHFTNLTELNCGGCCMVSEKNINEMKSLKYLKVLKISNNRKIKNIDSLINLIELDCSWVNNEMANENLKNLTTLKKINIRNNNKITDLNMLINLEYLICNNVIKIEGINNLKKLKLINIKDNSNIKEEDLKKMFNGIIIISDYYNF